MVDTTLWILIIGLVAYRIWRFFAEDSITEPLRIWLYGRPRVGGFLGDWLSCGWCAGSWTVIAVTFILRNRLEYPLLVALAAAVVTGKISQHES